MTCQECQALLWDYIEGSTTKEQKQQIQEHLHTCSACQQEKKILCQMYDVLHTMPQEELPEGYHARLMAKINAEAAKNTNVRPFPRKQQKSWKNIGVVAAALLMVAALGGIQGLQALREPQQNMTAQITRQSESDGEQAAPKNRMVEQMQFDMIEQSQTTEQQNDTQNVTYDTAAYEDIKKQAAVTESVPKQSMEYTMKQEVQNKKNVTPKTDTKKQLQNVAPKVSKTVTQPQSADGVSAQNVAVQSSEKAKRMESEGSMADHHALDIASVSVSEETTQKWTVAVESISDAMQQIRTEIKNQSWKEVGITEKSITIELQECQVQALCDIVESIGEPAETISVAETTSEARTQVTILFQAI